MRSRIRRIRALFASTVSALSQHRSQHWSQPPWERGTDVMPTEVVHPLSSQQELWCGQPGAFGPRFIVTKSLRITGHVDVVALQGALDDVVARHEMLRTVVVPDAQPPHQRVH